MMWYLYQTHYDTDSSSFMIRLSMTHTQVQTLQTASFAKFILVSLFSPIRACLCLCVAVKYSGESVHLSGHQLTISCFYTPLLLLLCVCSQVA